LIAVTKMNPNSGTATFSYTDGANQASGSHSAGIVFERANNGLSFEAPYSANPQELMIWFGGWSVKAELLAEVINPDQSVAKSLVETFDTGSQAGGTSAQYHSFRLNYQLDDPSQFVRLTLKAATAYDQTWGNISVSAIALSERLEVTVDPAVSNGKIRIAPNFANKGETVKVFAAPNAGYQLLPGSLQYKTAGGSFAITGDSFAMPGENAVVTGEFVKDISIDSRAAISPLDVSADGKAFKASLLVAAQADLGFTLVVAAYDSNGVLISVKAEEALLGNGESKELSVVLEKPIGAASWKFFVLDANSAPLTRITKAEDLP
jgi:hypothetical protein